jgi:hypothetical protein
MNAAVAAAMLAGVGTPVGNARWSSGEAKRTSKARALRDGRLGSQRGTPAEQNRRIAAAQEKRARKANRQHRNALKDGTEFRA